MNEKLVEQVARAIRDRQEDSKAQSWTRWDRQIDQAQAAIAAHSAFIREAAGRDDARYARSCVHRTIGGKRYVAILDRKDKEAAIALVPFNEWRPSLSQLDVDLIVSALNRSAMLDQIERTPDAQG